MNATDTNEVLLELKFRHGTGKWILREALYRHVPREMIECPKNAFSIPLEVMVVRSVKRLGGGSVREGAAASRGRFYATTHSSTVAGTPCGYAG